MNSHSPHIYQASTNGIVIRVRPEYVDEQSRPESDYYFFTYHIEMQNTSDDVVQLQRRHWVIRDGQLNIEEVEGEGVVGEKPVLRPGDTYQYTSHCPLRTPTGAMRGTYLFKNEKGDSLEIEIPLFFLAAEIYH